MGWKDSGGLLEDSSSPPDRLRFWKLREARQGIKMAEKVRIVVNMRHRSVKSINTSKNRESYEIPFHYN